MGAGLLLASSGCASSGTSCTDKGGTCNSGLVCPEGTALPTMAQLDAAGTESGAYSCTANTTAVDAGTDLPYCCLPIPPAK